MSPSKRFELLASLVADSLQIHVKSKEGKNYIHYRRNRMLTGFLSKNY